MNKRIRALDRFGNELEDEEDGRIVVPDGGSVSVSMPFMDSRNGTYVLRDGAGRPAGVASVDGALKVQDAYERYCTRLSSAHKRHRAMTDADPLTPPSPKVKFTGTCPSCGYSEPGKDAAPVELSASQLAYRAYVARLSAHRHV